MASRKTTLMKAPAKSPAKNKATEKASAPAKAGVSLETCFKIAGEQILMEEINEKIRQDRLSEGHFPSRLRSNKTCLKDLGHHNSYIPFLPANY